ncbi:YciI family protein [Candidatus Bipolaricaulota bacterium]
MKNFIVLYRAPADMMAMAAAMTPEERAKGMEAWMDWAKGIGDGLVDMGAPLANGQLLSPDGTSKKSGTDVAGYSILQAENMEEAKKLLAGHPHLAWNAACSIEVYETMVM